jgi:hypothetical protein
MINPSLRVTVIVASQTPDHLACRPRRDRNLNVGQTLSRNLDMMSSRGRQSNQSLCDSIANNDNIVPALRLGRIVVANCRSEQKKALKWRKNSRLRARHLTAEACRYLRLTNSIAGTQADDLSAN